jgi:hypothetical protein
LHFSAAKGRFDVAGIGAGLLTACHITALETRWLPLECNRLEFPSSGEFLRWVGSGRLKGVRIKGVRIDEGVGD